MVSLTLLPEDMQSAIQRSIEDEAQRIREVYIKEAVEGFEKQLRHFVATASVALATQYTMERSGPDLLIRVKLG